MPSLVETIKQTALAAVEHSKPVAFMPGTVVSADPICISVEQRMELPADFLIMTETVRERSLQEGDSVLLLRMQGGQKFIVIDRM